MYFDQYHVTKSQLERRLLDETDYEARHKIKCDILEHNTRFLADFKRYMSKKGFALQKKSRWGFYGPKRVFYRDYVNILYWKSRWGYERTIEIRKIRGLKKINHSEKSQDPTKKSRETYELVIHTIDDEESHVNALFTPAIMSATTTVTAFHSSDIYREIIFRFEFEEDRDLLYDSIQLLMVH